DQNATIQYEAGLLGQLQARPHADPDDRQVGLESCAAFKSGATIFDRRYGVLQVEDNAMLFMQPAHEVAHLRAQHALHRPLLGSNDVHFDVARTKRGRSLQSDETCPEDKRATRAFRLLDDGAAVAERPQGVDM